jgi:uncharacterized protein
MPSMNDFGRYRALVNKAIAAVRPQFALHFRHGIHGLPHWSRVWFHGRGLALAEGVDPAILAWFAFLHDSRRLNDGWDPEHGRRAADFATQLRREGVITELSPSDFERLCEAMQLHSDGHTEGDPALRACWDADRLDLWRVGILPAPERLCTVHARREEVLARANRMAGPTRAAP